MRSSVTRLLLLPSCALGLTAAMASAAVIADSGTAPTAPFIAQGGTDGGGTSVRWRNTGTDTDLGSTFLVPANASPQTLGSISVRVTPQDWTTNGPTVRGQTLIVDFFSYNAANGALPGSFTSLWRETATLPTTTDADDYLTIDLSSRNQPLTPGSSYAFLIGFLNEGDGTQGFRLYTAASDITPNAFEIRRDYEFGTSRPAANATFVQADLRTTRDVQFYVQAVPEPASLSLVAVAGLALARRRRA